MKFVKYTNDRFMTNITVTYTIGGYELARLLASYGDGPELSALGPATPMMPGAKLTRSAVEKLLRRYVHAYGQNSYLSEDDFDPERSYTPAQRWLIASWAAGEVRRLWPELDDIKLRRWENEYFYAPDTDDGEGEDASA